MTAATDAASSEEERGNPRRGRQVAGARGASRGASAGSRGHLARGDRREDAGDGLVRLHHDERYGGLGLSAGTYAHIIERISAVWMSVAGIINSDLIMAALVQRAGTEEQKRRFLPRFASGELRGALALTEPDCGTDLQAIRTAAQRHGEHYVVNGTKIWISNGIQGHCVATLVKTDPRAEPAHRGMSVLICEKGPGFSASRQAGETRLQGDRQRRARVPGLLRSGRQPDRWRRGPRIAAGPRRSRAGTHQCGGARRRHCGAALEESVRYAQQRKTFGKSICEHQAIQLKLADMATRVEAARSC